MFEADNLIKLNDAQLEEQLSTIVDFLSEVHPSLLSEAGYKPCVEIRPINRGEKREFILNKSLNIWDLSDNTIERIKAFLERHNGKPTCLFYSVFTYDNAMESVTSKGTKAKPGKITKASALSTEEIALDFDNIGYEEHLELVERFQEMGIHALWVFSGHGYQAHILIDGSITDKDILKRVVYKFRSKGFNCDTSCIDPARVMRLPGTFNCKCVSDDSYDDVEPPHCEITFYSVHRYSLDYVISELDKLPTVSTEDDDAFNEISSSAKDTSPAGIQDIGSGFKSKISKPTSTSTATDEVDEDVVQVSRIIYPYLDNYDLPEAISKMLAHTPHGYRNKTLGFLIKFFTKHYRMSKQSIWDITEIWSQEACEPAYPPKEFSFDFSRLYNMGGLNYDSALSKQFGIIDFAGLIELRKKDVAIPHKFFKDFDKLDGTVVRLYLAIKTLEHIDVPATQEELSKLLGISDRALRPTLQALCKSGHGYMSKGNRRLKEPNTYHTHRGYSARDGYVTFSYNDVRAYIKELHEGSARGNGELKLYLFMRYKFYTGDVYMSQYKLGNHIGVARNTISGLVYRLQEKHFLKIQKVKIGCFDSCVYELLR